MANLSSTLAFSSPDFFPVGQTVNTLPESIAAAAKKANVKNLATMYCAEASVCAGLATPIAKAAHAVGVKSSYSAAISASAPNYTAPCLAAKQSGADGIFVGQASQVVVSFVSSCARQGYKPTYIAEASAISNAFLSSSALTGMIGSQNNLPAYVTTNTAIRTMTKALNRYVPGTVSSPNYSPYTTTVWAAGMLFAAAGTHISADSAPSAQILKGLFALHGTTLQGLSPPLTFKQSHATTIGCWFYMSVRNQRYVAPYGTAPHCM